VLTFSGVVQDADTEEPIDGASVTFMLTEAVTVETPIPEGAPGSFSAELASPGLVGEYAVIVTADDYITYVGTTAGWDFENGEIIELTPAVEGGTISGTVTDGQDPIGGARVEATVDDVLVVAYSDVSGAYTLNIPVPVDALGEELIATASKLGYLSESQDVLGDPNFVLVEQAALFPQDVCEAGGTFQDQQQQCTVEIPAGALDQCYPLDLDPDIEVGEETLYTEKSAFLVEIDLGGAVLDKPIKVTMPFDTADVNPGDFKAGNAVIYHAPTADDLRNGTNLKIVSTSDIVFEDHAKGMVCFLVRELSVFGAGGAQAQPQPQPVTPIGGGGGGCFISTMESGAAVELSAVFILVLAFALSAYLVIRQEK
jgi:hypothetical protein